MPHGRPASCSCSPRLPPVPPTLAISIARSNASLLSPPAFPPAVDASPASLIPPPHPDPPSPLPPAHCLRIGHGLHRPAAPWLGGAAAATAPPTPRGRPRPHPCFCCIRRSGGAGCSACGSNGSSAPGVGRSRVIDGGSGNGGGDVSRGGGSAWRARWVPARRCRCGWPRRRTGFLCEGAAAPPVAAAAVAMPAYARVAGPDSRVAVCRAGAPVSRVWRLWWWQLWLRQLRWLTRPPRRRHPPAGCGAAAHRRCRGRRPAGGACEAAVPAVVGDGAGP